MPQQKSKSFTKPHSIEFRVRTYECDSYLHVNNAVYLNYLEMARQEYLIAGGLNYEEMRRTGYGLIITEINIKYKKAAESGDWLRLETSAKAIRATSGILIQEIYRGEELITQAEVTFAHISPQGRPAKLPEVFSKHFFHPGMTA
jgi:YbgC/YbaW family acyl-CoA thioester hydrolase